MKTIKILTSQHFPNFDKEINEYLKNGWKTKGNLVFDENGKPFMVLYK